MIPSPRHASQRPPFTLKLNRPFLYPLALASEVEAKRSRIMSNTPVYVAGLDLGVLPMGDWSMLITLSSNSIPFMSLCFPGMHRARFSVLARDLYRISFTRELLPEPDTPVTQVNTPSGNSTLIFFKLFSLAPVTFRYPDGDLLSFGTGITILRLRYAPVIDFFDFMISCADPAAITSPPCSPAPGPISTT